MPNETLICIDWLFEGGFWKSDFRGFKRQKICFFRDWILQDNSSSFAFGANFSNDLIPMFFFLVFPSILWPFYIFFLSSWAWRNSNYMKSEESTLKTRKNAPTFFYEKNKLDKRKHLFNDRKLGMGVGDWKACVRRLLCSVQEQRPFLWSFFEEKNIF